MSRATRFQQAEFDRACCARTCRRLRRQPKRKPGEVFAALAGQPHRWARFIADAVTRGAGGHRRAAAFGSPDHVASSRAECRRAMALALRASHRGSRVSSPRLRAPAADIGCTPSSARSGGRARASSGSVGTVGVVAPSGETYGSLTTPDPVALHRTLDRWQGRGHPLATKLSHGLDQHRLEGHASRSVLSPISAAIISIIIRRRCLFRRQARLFSGFDPRARRSSRG